MNLYRRLHPETFREERPEPHGLALLSRAERRAGVPMVPLVERREPSHVPEWLRRSRAERERVGFVAVADLSRTVSA